MAPRLLQQCCALLITTAAAAGGHTGGGTTAQQGADASSALPPADASTVAKYFEQYITVVEAENMTAPGGGGGWEAREWAHSPNYFAASLADTFLSRRAYLHAPANSTGHDVASASMKIGRTDNYHVLLRYEALYRFETPFRVTVEQGGQVVMEEVYGRRSNLKVWPFSGGRMGCGDGLVAECVWPYGATESVLWEGVGKTAFLQQGMATITLTAVHDCPSPVSDSSSTPTFPHRHPR
jgi:hypothetical protein